MVRSLSIISHRVTTIVAQIDKLAADSLILPLFKAHQGIFQWKLIAKGFLQTF